MAGYREPLEDAQFFKLSEPCMYMPPENSHVVSRSTVRVIPQTGTDYKSDGNRVVRIILPSTGFLDTQNSYFMFELNNSSDKRISATFPAAAAGGAPVSVQVDSTEAFGLPAGAGVASLFQRIRILVGGSVIEDVNMYNLVANMLLRCGRTSAVVNNDGCKQTSFMEGYHDNQTVLASRYCYDNKFWQFMHKPMNGVLNNIRYLPLAYIGEMTIEITLEEPKSAFCDTRQVKSGNDSLPPMNASYSYQLRNFNYQCDILQFDSEYIQGFEQAMLTRGINIPFDTFTHYKSTTTSLGDLVINHRGRNVKNLWTMLRPGTDVSSGNGNAMCPTRSGLSSWQLRIGAFMKPLLPVRCGENLQIESFMEFLKTLTGFNRIDNGDVDIVAGKWGSQVQPDGTPDPDDGFFVIGVDLEREGQIASGLDTASEATPITLALTRDGASTGNGVTHLDTFIHAGANLIISSPHEVTLFT